MTIKQINDLNVPLGEILKAMGAAGGVLEIPGKSGFALLPLSDDLLDFLLEQSPKLAEECRQIRERMRAGQFHTHDEVKKLLGV